MYELLRNVAFISYSHHDVKVADWLQRQLEGYVIPRSIPHPVMLGRKTLAPIFRDRTDLTAGILSEIIDQNLEASKFLIVICSPHAAKSQWVSHEVQYFLEHDRLKRIILISSEGIPFCGTEQECIPKAMRDHVALHPEQELLCVNIQTEGEEKAFLAVVSRILNVPFDKIYNRERRHRKRYILSRVAVILSLILITGYFMTPVSSTVQVRDAMHHLPIMEGARLSIGGSEYALTSFDTLLVLPDLPGYRRVSDIDVEFTAPFYDTLRTQFRLGFGIHNEFELHLQRDASFSTFSGVVYSEDGDPIEGAYVTVAKNQSRTTKNGLFNIVLPVEIQAEYQTILIQKDGFEEIYREDECPSLYLKYVMHPLRDDEE